MLPQYNTPSPMYPTRAVVCGMHEEFSAERTHFRSDILKNRTLLGEVLSERYVLSAEADVSFSMYGS